MEIRKTSARLLADFEGPAAELINRLGKAPVVLICEHASNFIPASLSDLGLNSEGQVSHAAWDLGAYEVACKLSESLDAPLIASRISRLVYDCNRDPESGLGIPGKSELFDVPGNRNLSDVDKNDRVNAVYEPFHQLIKQVINTPGRNADVMQQAGPAIITIHSFTSVYFGEKRSVELGLLHDKDDRLASAMMTVAKCETNLNTQFNAPYDASDNVMHTLNKHAQKGSLLNVMIEVKNDLLSNADDINAVASSLSKIITKALARLNASNS